MAIVKCDDDDVALVMHTDGQIEIHARRFEAGELVPRHVVLALTIAERLVEDQEFCRDLMAWAKARGEQIMAADKQTVN